MRQNQDWALLILRIVIGAIFLYHGYTKWPIGADTSVTMMILAVAEPLGGLAVLLGFLPRYAAAGLGIIMLGAIYNKMMVWNIGFAGQQSAGWEFDLMILAGCIIVMAFGAGSVSIDRMWRK